MRARICPISGAGKLSASERKRRAREIVAESGADSVEHFNKVVQPQKKDCVSLKQQASRWLEHLRKRKRKLIAIKKSEWTPQADEGIRCLLHNLTEVSDKADAYANQLRAVLAKHS